MSNNRKNFLRRENPWQHGGFSVGWVYPALLSAAFIKSLYALAVHALDNDLYSYILLVPFVSAYLLNLRRKGLPRTFVPAPGWTIALAAIGLTALAAGRGWLGPWQHDQTDSLTWLIISYLCLLAAGGFFFLGRAWMAGAAFPTAFLVFMIPLPGPTAAWLETVSQSASADIASLFFNLSSTPNLRDGFIFQLPNIIIEVAQECSGIRSSLVLFLTSILAANLFLRSTWRRMLLVALVIPLGLLRNGFRIWTIGQLCVYVGPHMIHSPIHKRGGPVFFTLSLLPLLLLIWWLRRGEVPRHQETEASSLPESEAKNIFSARPPQKNYH